MKHKQTNIVIVGGGLAGLSTAYFLLKNKKTNCTVTVLEALDRTGGRVYTKEIDETPVDMGAFMIFPFYKELRSLIDELHLFHTLKKISDIEFYRLKKGGWTQDKSISIFNIFPPKLIIRAFRLFVFGKIDYYEPDLELLGNQSCYEFLLKSGVSKETIEIQDTILRGYGYPSIKELSASICMPVLVKLLSNGMFNRCMVLDGGTSKLIERLVTEIKNSGGTVITNERVTKLQKKSVLTEKKNEYTYDHLILTSQMQVEVNSHSMEVDTPKYTHYDSIAIEFSQNVKIDDKKKWFIAYQEVRKNEPQITAFYQMSSFSSLPDTYLEALLLWPEGQHPTNIESIKNHVIELAGKAFPENTVKNIAYVHRWRKTMPTLNTTLLKKYRQQQGVNNIWYAGDFLSFPCMDTAVYSGKKTAKNILDSLQQQ